MSDKLGKGEKPNKIKALRKKRERGGEKGREGKGGKGEGEGKRKGKERERKGLKIW